MNIELIEKLSAIRDDLLAFQAQVTDVKKLADLVKQKLPVEGLENAPVWRNCWELRPYMTAAQRDNIFPWLFAIGYSAGSYLRTGKDSLTDSVTRFVPLMIADLDDIRQKA